MPLSVIQPPDNELSAEENDSSSCSSDSSDYDSDDVENHESIVARRKRRMEKKRQMLSKIMRDLDQDAMFQVMKSTTPRAIRQHNKPPQQRRQRRSCVRDMTPRRVTRGMAANNQGPEDHLLEDGSAIDLRPKFNPSFRIQLKRRQSDSGDEDAPRKRRSDYTCRKDTPAHIVIPVEEVTAEMLANIAERSAGKVYDKINGTSCHQCRQKTIDTKSCCRSPECHGVRGAFCGPCLKNR